MVERIPSTFNVQEMQSFAKLFETWHSEHHLKLKQIRRQRTINWIRKYLGWIVAVVALVKPIVDAILSIRALWFP